MHLELDMNLNLKPNLELNLEPRMKLSSCRLQFAVYFVAAKNVNFVELQS